MCACMHTSDTASCTPTLIVTTQARHSHTRVVGMQFILSIRRGLHPHTRPRLTYSTYNGCSKLQLHYNTWLVRVQCQHPHMHARLLHASIHSPIHNQLAPAVHAWHVLMYVLHAPTPPCAWHTPVKGKSLLGVLEQVTHVGDNI
jgi:hypothetical protein